ncbi:MAG: HAD family hydrolase [Pseudomonadota bacterium]|nr:HAD family hydrolase [Pseudomonadota bacterium]
MNQEKFKKIDKACFLDRDGVINEDIGYLHKISDFKWTEGAIEAIKLLRRSNFLVIVITNQSGVGRGFFSKKDVEYLHNWMNDQLKKQKTKIDDFFFSTDLPNSGKDSDRKPSPKMIINAAKKYKLDLNQCFLIGDKSSDIKAAENAGIEGFLFKKGNLLDKVTKILQDHFK